MPSIDPDAAAERLRVARVGRLATVRPDGGPHVVPLVFAVVGPTAYWVVDDKPKRSRALQRLENIRREPRVELLVDGYDEEWSRLWWVRARGRARLVRDDGERVAALGALGAKYRAYASLETETVVAIDLDAIVGWSAT
jgi:PPOX class probable F420-dependent enzyme